MTQRERRPSFEWAPMVKIATGPRDSAAVLGVQGAF
jgi:hypothetical protein